MAVHREMSLPADEQGIVSHSLSILLVEDSRSNRKIIAGLLRKRGHRVVSVESGREALKRCINGRFHAVLMDIEMPAMNGYRTAAAIRRTELSSNSRTPIIALTAHLPAADRQEWLEVGMDGYMTKPINIDRLILLIRDILRHGNLCGRHRRRTKAGR